jgi:hypothetical protein
MRKSANSVGNDIKYSFSNISDTKLREELLNDVEFGPGNLQQPREHPQRNSYLGRWHRSYGFNPMVFV